MKQGESKKQKTVDVAGKQRRKADKHVRKELKRT